jgi:hypothetical protein
MPGSELNPRVTARNLPPRITRNRLEQAARDAADQPRLEQPIAAHVAERRIALDALATAHQELADKCDLNLTGNTRPAAVWQMAGRCLGIARALICLVEQGFTAEMLHLGRAPHEATRLLSALGDREEDALLLQWLAGEYVSPGAVRVGHDGPSDSVIVLAPLLLPAPMHQVSRHGRCLGHQAHHVRASPMMFQAHRLREGHRARHPCRYGQAPFEPAVDPAAAGFVLGYAEESARPHPPHKFRSRVVRA